MSLTCQRVHPHLKLDALILREISCVVRFSRLFFATGRREVSYVRFNWKGWAFVFSVKCKRSPF